MGYGLSGEGKKTGYKARGYEFVSHKNLFFGESHERNNKAYDGIGEYDGSELAGLRHIILFKLNVLNKNLFNLVHSGAFQIVA